MKPIACILTAVLSAAAVSLGFNVLSAPKAVEGSGGPEAIALEAAVERLSRSLIDVRADQQALLDELSELRMAQTSNHAPSERLAVGEIEAAVARYLEQRTGEDALPSDVLTDALAPGSEPFDAGMAIAILTDDDLSWEEREELWQKLRSEGRLDELLAEFERRAEMDPSNPDAQVDLGYAYIQKIQEVGNSALAGKWAMKADETFDVALELDPEHWEARFSKAIALSHWPAFTGKSSEAIRQFEVLIDQQETGPSLGHHAQSYYYLGNMYQQVGKLDEAIAAWERGLALFPGNELILRQLELVR